MGDLVVMIQDGISQREKYSVYEKHKISNGRRSLTVTAPNPRWMRRTQPVSQNASNQSKAAVPSNNSAYFKSVPLTRAQSCTHRPLMGAACLACTPSSKESSSTETCEYLGLWNILQVPERNPDRSIWSRAFCHLLHTYRITGDKSYPVIPVEKMQRNPAVCAAVTATADSEMADRPTERYTSITRKQEKRVKSILYQLRSRISTLLVRFTAWALYKFLGSLLLSVQVHKGELERIKQACKSPHPLIFIPLHRSHLDYFLVTFILNDAGIRVPHVAAGDNLNISIVGYILRRLGAFFIKRKLDPINGKKDMLYRAVLQSYMLSILENGENLEFFIEGGRTRTGKPQMPKGGLLSVVVDAQRRGIIDDALIVPVGIGYEKIVEGGFVDELLGKPKVMETTWRAFKGVVTSLCGNYGHARVDFAQPFSLKEYLSSFNTGHHRRFSLAEGNGVYGTELVNEEYRSIVSSLGRHVVYDATFCTAVMSTHLVAFIMLNGFRQGCELQKLVKMFSWLRARCHSKRLDVGFSGSDEEVVSHAIRMLSRELQCRKEADVFLVKLRPHVTRVLSLQYYSNSVLSTFCLDAVVATCLLVKSSPETLTEVEREVAISQEELYSLSENLCELLEQEFLFCRPCEDLRSAIIERETALNTLAILRYSESRDTRRARSYALEFAEESSQAKDDHLILNLSPKNLEYLKLLSRSIAPLITSYFYTVVKLNAVVGTQVEEKAFIKLVQEDMRQRTLPYCECVSVQPIKHAVKTLKSKGVVGGFKRDSVELLYLTEDYDDEDRVAEIMVHVGQFIV